MVAIAGGARLLYVSSAAPVAIPDGYRVVRIAPEDVARNAGALSAFDVVLLDDVEPERLDGTQRRAIAQHVEQGGGLFVLGGPRSLLPPDERDPLDAALPLDLRPRRGQRAPGLALVVVFDKSGSMDDRIDGAAKIEFARQAVARVLASLPPTDAVGVIAFDSEAVDVAPLRPGHEAASLAGRLDGVRPSGATAIAPAVERAVGWLRGPAAAGYARRLVLLVSDGRTSPADQARARAALRVPGIDVSTVALGDEADRRFLGELADAGNGRAFYPRRLGELPALAAREAVRVSGGHVVDERFTVQATRHPVLSGLDTSAMPVLGGYVVGSPKPGAEVALQSPLGDPVLALWRHGLGKVAVYTADLRSPWSAGLRAWRDGPALLAQTARWVSRRVDHPFLHTAIAEHDGRLALTVEARGNDGGFLSGLDVRAQARTPSGEPEELALIPAGPGVYEASLALTEPGPYLFSIAAASPDGTLDARVQRGFFWTAAQERAGETDTAALAEIARALGRARVVAGRRSLRRPAAARPPRRGAVAGGRGAAALPERRPAPVHRPFGARAPCHHGHIASGGGMKRWLVLVLVAVGFVIGSKLLVENVLGIPMEALASRWLDHAGVGTATLIVLLLAADVALPIPSSLVMVLSGAAFGVVWGSIVALVGSIAGEWIGFELVRRYGRGVSRGIVGADEFERFSAFFERHGTLAVMLTRPLPVVMETMSLVAGLSGMSRAAFLGASLAGTAPIVVVYAYAGAVSREVDSVVPAVVILVAVAACGYAWYRARFAPGTGSPDPTTGA